MIRNKSKWLAAVLAFLLPGAGHLYVGRYPRGLLLLAGLLLDGIAIFRLSNADGGRHLLLIVYLIMALPVFYFVSVYDCLQSMDRDRTERSEARAVKPVHGLLLAGAGLVMLLLLKPPPPVLPWMNDLAEWSTGPLLLLISAISFVALFRGKEKRMQVGRFTASAIVFALGALLLWDRIADRNDIAHLLQWWPAWFVLLGAEMTVYSAFIRHKLYKLRFDAGGSAAALVIAVTAYAVTQYADYPAKWLDQFNIDINGYAEYGEEAGFRYDKPVIKIPVAEHLSSLRISNLNGDVKVATGDVRDIELRAVVWVDVGDEQEAAAVAEASIVHVGPGNETVIEAKGASYGANGTRKPKMNLEVVLPMSLAYEPPSEPPTEEAGTEGEPAEEEQSGIGDSEEAGEAGRAGDSPTGDGVPTPDESAPEDRHDANGLPETDGGDAADPESVPESEPNDADESPAFRLDVQAVNGSVEVAGLSAEGGLNMVTGNGMIKLERVNGPIRASSEHGSIEASTVTGDVSLETTNGSITAEYASGGSLYAGAANGSLNLRSIEGHLSAETKNGEISIVGAMSSVKADTLNGSIKAASPVVGGNWDLDSSVGEIVLGLPEEGHFTLYGSVTFGEIASEFPFEQARKTVRGAQGEGTYRIQINATNSIVIQHWRYG